MRLIRSILVFCGILTLVFAGILWVKIRPVLPELDPKFADTYLKLAARLLETQNLGVALIKSVPVQPGITPEDVVESLKSLAVSRNFLFTGETPIYKQIEATTGEPFRYINLLSFCDAKAGKALADYQPAYTALMPCRIALAKDKAGHLWLHTLDLELIIHGGKELPLKAKEDALRVWDNIQFIMEGAAKGEF